VESFVTVPPEREASSHEGKTQIFSFLPSKPGVGTSTIALNISVALARRLNARVLLSDFDLNCGMLRFMLNLQNEHSVIDAVSHALHMDESHWSRLISSRDELDLLHAGNINPYMRIEGSHIRNLVAFMRRKYQTLCFDLSGNLERYSVALMEQSNRVLLVCTPEIPSLHLARQKINFLRTLNLEDRVLVVLNRSHKKSVLSKARVEEVLGLPVLKTFANDYNGVDRALTAASWIAPGSALGKSFAEFVEVLLNWPEGTPDHAAQAPEAVPASARPLVSSSQ